MSRRDLIRRGAAVGALTWAAPAIQSFSNPAFATHGTPEGAISHVNLVWTCDGVCCAVKYETDPPTFEACNAPQGCEPAGWPSDTAPDSSQCSTTLCADQGDCQTSDIRVFDRNGEICFELTNPDCSWVDGETFAGSHGCVEPSSQTSSVICFDDPEVE